MDGVLSPAAARALDRRRQAVVVAVAAGVAVAVAILLTAQHASVWAALLAAAPIPGAAWLGTLHAFTDTDASGLRSRRFLRIRSVAWPEVQALESIAASTKTGQVRRAVVRTTRGGKFTLGAPFQAGDDTAIPFDRDFDRLRGDRQAATRPEGGGPPQPRSASRITLPPHRMSRLVGVGAVVVMLAMLVDIDAGTRAAWDAHLGRGTSGTFTVTSKQCNRSCDDYGDFVASGTGVVRPDVKLAGAHELAVGDQEAARDTGGSMVFPADGGWSWAGDTGGQMLFAVVLAFSVVKLVVNPLRRRREARLAAS